MCPQVVGLLSFQTLVALTFSKNVGCVGNRTSSGYVTTQIWLIGGTLLRSVVSVTALEAI